MFQHAIGKMKGWLAPGAGGTQARAEESCIRRFVVYYWDGSAPEGRRIHDISQSGAYICTPERWYLGTIIRLILQGRPGGQAGGWRDGSHGFNLHTRASRKARIRRRSRRVRFSRRPGGGEFPDIPGRDSSSTGGKCAIQRPVAAGKDRPSSSSP